MEIEVPVLPTFQNGHKEGINFKGTAPTQANVKNQEDSHFAYVVFTAPRISEVMMWPLCSACVVSELD